MEYQGITPQDFDAWVTMGFALWPDHTRKELDKEFADILASKKETAIICRDENQPIAFVNISLRSDYVEGATSSPVGYIEGIYVKPMYRNQGVGRELVRRAEQWALEQGCSEMGSDTELDNVDSQDFHQKIGFQEAHRGVSFIKKIENSDRTS